MYKIHKIEAARTRYDKTGRSTSISATIHLMAPTKRGDDWSLYLGGLCVDANSRATFDVTHINSSAWGNSAWRAAPYGYDRADIKHFVLNNCQALINEWQAKLALNAKE